METIDTEALVALCPDPVIGVDGKGQISLFNVAAERLLGYEAKSVVRRMHITELYMTEDDARYVQRCMLSSPSNSRCIRGVETRLKSKEQREIPIRLSAFLLANGSGSVGFFHDLTQTKALETELRLLSITDSLTGLHNQRHFYETLTRELTIIKSRSNAPPLSLLCIDLDCLKQVNDRLGHLEGDQVLRDVAAAIEAHVRSQDISFRYGGDEFMVLMPETCIKEAESIAQKICAEFDTLCKYSRCSAHRVASCASLSIGATQSNGSDDRETIVSRADLGMYRAKHAGGRAVVVVDQNESICVTTNVANAKANVS